MLTVQSILSDKSIVAFLALAEMTVIAANQFDLSVGFMVSLLHAVAIGLMVNNHLPWPLVFALIAGLRGWRSVRSMACWCALPRSTASSRRLAWAPSRMGWPGGTPAASRSSAILPGGFLALDHTRIAGCAVAGRAAAGAGRA